MASASTSLHYTNTAIVLHWLMGVAIIAALAMGLYMVDLRISPQKLQLYSWHKWLGVTIFILAAARLLWRLTHTPPAEVSMSKWQLHAAAWGHRLFYVMFFAIPISGWLFSSAKGFPTVYLGLVPLPDLVQKNDELAVILKAIHQYAGYGLAAMIVGHIGAAIQHELAEPKHMLRRMLPARFFQSRSSGVENE
jgi:cytochrome b561